jgi:hypothetical protein
MHRAAVRASRQAGITLRDDGRLPQVEAMLARVEGRGIVKLTQNRAELTEPLTDYSPKMRFLGQ